MNALWKDVLEALESALPIIQFDAQMMADITRHAPLDPESQAKHDSTEYASEHLVRTIPPLIERLKAALAEPQPEPATQNDWMWEDCGTALESMTCPWCDRQGTDICQHANDAKNCEKTK